jgi:uncharacterized protein YkwD
MRAVKSILAASVFALVCQAASAETADSFNAAYAKAQAAEKKAGELRNQWTTTEAALKGAKKAADGGDFDHAVQLAKQAEDMANASIAQSEREDKAWTESEIR